MTVAFVSWPFVPGTASAAMGNGAAGADTRSQRPRNHLVRAAPPPPPPPPVIAATQLSEGVLARLSRMCRRGRPLRGQLRDGVCQPGMGRFSRAPTI
jgi:hypothetical protein